MNRFLPVVLVSILCCAGAGATPRTPAPSPTADAVVVPPKRIVSLVPHATEMLFGIGAGQRVVGVSDGCRWPAETNERPRLGGMFQDKMDEIVALKPDLAILSPSHVLHRSKLRALGIEVLTVESKSINDALQTLYELSVKTDCMVKGKILCGSMLDEINVRYKESKPLARRRTLICMYHESDSLEWIIAIADKNYLDDLVAAAGGKNVAARSSNQLGITQRLTADEVRALAPEIVLDFSVLEKGQAEEGRKFREMWVELFASSDRPPLHIYAVHDSYIGVPGVRIADSFGKMLDWIHPDRPKKSDDAKGEPEEKPDGDTGNRSAEPTPRSTPAESTESTPPDSLPTP